MSKYFDIKSLWLLCFFCLFSSLSAMEAQWISPKMAKDRFFEAIDSEKKEFSLFLRREPMRKDLCQKLEQALDRKVVIRLFLYHRSAKSCELFNALIKKGLQVIILNKEHYFDHEWALFEGSEGHRFQLCSTRFLPVKGKSHLFIEIEDPELIIQFEEKLLSGYFRAEVENGPSTKN